MRIFFKQAGAQRDFTVLGKFNGVGGIVEQCLAQACRIATQPAWHAFQIKHDGQALFASLAVNHRAHVVKNGFEVEVAFVQLHFFRLNLGKIEDVVDQFEQVFSSAFDLDQSFKLAWRWVAAAQQMSETDDGVHWCADFMAHIGQEGAFCHVGGVGLNARFGELGRASVDFVFEVKAVVVEFFAQTFFFGDVFLDRDVVRNGAVGPFDRGDGGELDEQRAVFALVIKFAFPGFASLQRFPHGNVRFVWRFSGFEYARILTDYLVHGVAGMRQEGFVNEFDVPFGISDGHGFRALPDGLRKHV